MRKNESTQCKYSCSCCSNRGKICPPLNIPALVADSCDYTSPGRPDLCACSWAVWSRSQPRSVGLNFGLRSPVACSVLRARWFLLAAQTCAQTLIRGSS
uniref:Uncharacterized protein n=1 Tax=Arundo donax TaxID=35708 RepID=A0A0A9DEC8_ARUDO